MFHVDVERCGKMWEGVERCGNWWKVSTNVFVESASDVTILCHALDVELAFLARANKFNGKFNSIVEIESRCISGHALS